MAWTVLPSDPKYTFNGYDICVHINTSAQMYNYEIDTVQRESGAANPWNSLGPGDGMVWGDDNWVKDVAAKGGFHPWATALFAAINARIAAFVATLPGSIPGVVTPPAPAAWPAVDPTTFAEFQTWLASNARWTDSPGGVYFDFGPHVAPVPTPQPTIGGTVWGPRLFIDGEAVEIGLVRNADGSRSMAVRANVPGIGWQLVKWV